MYYPRIFVLLFCLSPFFLFSSEADSLLSQLNATEDPLKKSELYLKLGDLYEYTNPSQALAYYQQAYRVANAVSMSSTQRTLSPDADILKAQSLRYIGIVFSDQGNFDNALEKFMEALQILEELRAMYTSPFRKDVDGKIAKLLNNIGIVYSRQGVFGIATEYYQNALDIYYELSDSISVAVAYSSLGIAEARQANLGEALNYFQQALDIYTLKAHREGMAQSYNNIGGIHYQLENWDEALNLYVKAHDVFNQMGYLHRVAATSGNIGMVYQQKKNYSLARDYLMQSLELRLELNDLGGIVESYNNLGSLYEGLDNHSTANEYYFKSYEIALEIGDQRFVAISLLNIGRGYFNSGQINRAIEKAKEGLDIAREHNFMFVAQSALQQLADYHAAKFDFQAAFEYSSQHYIVSQEILDEQKSRQINELEIEYRAREKQQRIELLEQEGEFNRLRLRQSRTLTFVLGLLFLTGLIITVFTLILLRQRNRIVLLKKENEAQKAIRKTDNDLKAILKTHAHGMLLFDSELNVAAFNEKANEWADRFVGISLKETDSFYNLKVPIIQELTSGIIQDALKGYSREVEKVFFDEDKNYYFKFFCNPVFEEGEDLIQSVSLMIENVTERRNSEEQILSDLKEKETLIKEIHHRVKNNMQVIMSLIRLQSHQFKDLKQSEAFRDLEQRIAAMSYVHEDLYKSENLSDIRFEDYLRKIASNLSGSVNTPVRLYNHIDMKNPYLNIDLAMPCGLVVNELISNSLKHAFPLKGNAGGKSENRIDIYFAENPLNYELRIVDNGKGLKEGFDPHNTESLGFHLIKIIVEEQLRGTWQVSVNGGVKVNVVFPKETGNY
ncbi:MAG: hypothetical protein EA361_05840 [Bacteroidetes bacterium]|nr:MAG: hypothetical protein EA361_05840 [Bacteroidota bacterium]